MMKLFRLSMILALLISFSGAQAIYTAEKTFEQRVTEGDYTGYSFVEKFGENPDIDTATDPEDLWSRGGLYTFSTTADITKMSSSAVADSELITIEGLNSNWNYSTQTVQLQGQTSVTLDTTLIRVFRAYNANSVDLVGNVYIYVDTATVSSGTPDNDNETRAMISIGSGQTEMCIYTIPNGKTGYFYGGYVSLSTTGLNAGAVFTSKMRLDGGVFRTVSRIACVSTGRSSWDYKYPFPLALPAKTDLLLRCESVESNDTGVSGGFTILLKDD